MDILKTVQKLFGVSQSDNAVQPAGQLACHHGRLSAPFPALSICVTALIPS